MSDRDGDLSAIGVVEIRIEAVWAPAVRPEGLMETEYPAGVVADNGVTES
ncbi:MAG: hypothetical protein U0R19_11120 [Bryobacteraceae bacterium]